MKAYNLRMTGRGADISGPPKTLVNLSVVSNIPLHMFTDSVPLDSERRQPGETRDPPLPGLPWTVGK